MATLAREIEIDYGGVKVGGTTAAGAARKLDKVFAAEVGWETAIVDFEFVISDTVLADFATEIATLEGAFRTPDQDLVIMQGVSTLHSYKHSANTGFNARPKIIKAGDIDTDTGRSRRYQVRIEVDMPADKDGRAGRRNTDHNVSYLPSRRKIVNLSGTWTGISSNTARDQYEAQIDSYATSILNDLGGDYKLREEPETSHDDDNKLLTFTRVYEQIIEQSIGYSDADLRFEKLEISRGKVGPGDTPVGGTTVQRLVRLMVNYEVWVDVNESTDLTGKWDSVRSKIIDRAKDILTGGSVALVDENPRFDTTDNKFVGTMILMGSTVTGIIEYLQTAETHETSGEVLVGAWSGGKFDKYRYQGGANIKVRVTQTYKVFQGGGRPALVGTPLSPPGGMLSSPIDARLTHSPKRLGIDPHTFDIDEYTAVSQAEFYTEPGVGRHGGPGQTVTEDTTDTGATGAMIREGGGGGAGGGGAGTGAGANTPPGGATLFVGIGATGGITIGRGQSPLSGAIINVPP